jgi:hypothetical protein
MKLRWNLKKSKCTKEAEQQKFSFELEMKKLRVSTESNTNSSVKSEQVKYKGQKVPNLKRG